MDNFQAGNFPQQLPFDLPNVPIVSAQAFTYPTNIIDLAPGAQVTQSIQIDADSDFWLMKTQFNVASFDDGTPVSGVNLPNINALPVSISIRDTGDGKDLNKTPVLIGNLAGSGELPYIWPFPRRVRATAVLQVNLTNISAAATISGLQLTFGGAKIYYPSSVYGTRGN